jgi:hypothetical protein
MIIASIIAAKTLISGPRFSLWVADPSWIPDPVVRADFEVTTKNEISLELSIRGLTDDGRIFFVNPGSFWKRGECAIIYGSSQAGLRARYDLTFRLPDGQLVAGGSAMLNGYPDFGREVRAGSFFNQGSFTKFEGNYYITAVSPLGKLAGIAASDTDPTEGHNLGRVPCRIVNGKVTKLPMPKLVSSDSPTPSAISDDGTVISGDVGHQLTGALETCVWEPDNTFWTTRTRFSSNEGLIVFRSVKSACEFAGSQVIVKRKGGEAEVIEEPIYSDGRAIWKLVKLADYRSARVSHFYGEGFLGSYLSVATPRFIPHGCIWLRRKAYRLQDLLTTPSEWQIGRVGAINKKGQIAVSVWKLATTKDGKRIVNSFGLLTPVK